MTSSTQYERVAAVVQKKWQPLPAPTGCECDDVDEVLPEISARAELLPAQEYGLSEAGEHHGERGAGACHCPHAVDDASRCDYNPIARPHAREINVDRDADIAIGHDIDLSYMIQYIRQ